MRRSMAAALILTVLLFGGAYLTTGGSAAQEPESGDDTAQEPSGQGRRDSTVLLTVQDGDTAEEKPSAPDAKALPKAPLKEDNTPPDKEHKD